MVRLIVLLNWVEREGNPIASVPQSWADSTIDSPSFIRKDAGTIYLYMEGYDSSPLKGEMLGLLKSTDDGQSWIWETEGSPISDFANTSRAWSSNGDEACPAPVMVNGVLYMFYSSHPAGNSWGWNTGVATSSNWVDFTPANNGNPLVPLGGVGTWDETCVYHTSKPILLDGTWYMFYSGRDRNGNFGIGFMTTSEADFPTGWTKQTVDEPLWTSNNAVRPKVILVDGVYWLYYSTDTDVMRCYSTDLVNWSEVEPVYDLPFDVDIFEIDSGFIAACASSRWGAGAMVGIWDQPPVSA